MLRLSKHGAKASTRTLRRAQGDSLLLILITLLVLFLSACGNNKASSTNTKQVSAKPDSAAVSNKKTVLFFGDSLTAGYGLDDPSDDSYPSIVQKKIDSAKLPYSIVNAGVSGETSAGGLARIDWVLKKKVDVFVLELGANDGLRGIPVEATTDNLQAIIDKVKAKYPGAKIVLAGMMVPPSMGADYSNSFRGMFPKIAAKNNIALIPFLLYNVAGNPKLNQKDGIHPTAAGAKIVAGNVWSVLKAQL